MTGQAEEGIVPGFQIRPDDFVTKPFSCQFAQCAVKSHQGGGGTIGTGQTICDSGIENKSE